MEFQSRQPFLSHPGERRDMTPEPPSWFAASAQMSDLTVSSQLQSLPEREKREAQREGEKREAQQEGEGAKRTPCSLQALG